MNNLKVRKTFHAPENCPPPLLELLQGPRVSTGHYTRENVCRMSSATKQVTCVKRARTCFSKTPSLKVRVPVLVLMNIFVGAFLCSWNKRKYDQWWEVKFVGEGIIDQVGWYGTDHWDS